MNNLGNDLVMDVAHCNPTPGAEVISYKRKDPPGYNQLWKKVPTGENTFYLVSKLGSNCKVTIKVINPCSHLQHRHSKHHCHNPASNLEIFGNNFVSL